MGLTTSIAEDDSNRSQLPCETQILQAQHPFFCKNNRNYIRSTYQAVIAAWAQAFFDQTGTPLVYLDGSGPEDKRLWPHRSHGSGDQLDIALPFENLAGEALNRAPTELGYGSYEPPTAGENLPCPNKKRPANFGDPPKDRDWKLDENRTRILLRIVLDTPETKRIFLEPHLAKRLGFDGHPKVGFAGCFAARHDDHIHVNFE